MEVQRYYNLVTSMVIQAISESNLSRIFIECLKLDRKLQTPCRSYVQLKSPTQEKRHDCFWNYNTAVVARTAASHNSFILQAGRQG